MHRSTMRFPIHRRFFLWPGLLLPSVLCLGCGGPAPLTADMPLHLEDHLDAATIVGSEVPEDGPAPVVWRFDEPQPDWRPARMIRPGWEALKPVRVDDGLRLPLTAANRGRRALYGIIYVELPGWNIEHWGWVEIRARTADPIERIRLYFNYTEEDRIVPSIPFYTRGALTPLVTDGTVQTYRLPLDWSSMRSWEGPWTHLGIFVKSQPDEDAVTLDILSVRVIPREAEFATAAAGVRTVARRPRGDSVEEAPYRRTLYMHTPGKIAYRVRVPEAGRLDVGLGVLREDPPVTFAITATPQNGDVDTLLEETYAERQWGSRSVDLSHLAGQVVTVALEAEAPAGTVALWAAPTLSGARTTDRPNIIFYVIDGAGAEFMSVYGYNRRTTPNLERLAAEGAVFEHAYSNSSWTKPSTMSFMTSLQSSVLGVRSSMTAPVPEQAVTMAEHMHRARYQTAVFTSNPYAGGMSNLQRRGVDSFRDDGVTPNSVSSVELHENYWRWREQYPAEPYWVHFQTTDVHNPHTPVAPFAGLFISPTRRRVVEEWERRLRPNESNWDLRAATEFFATSFGQAGIDRVAYFTGQRDLHDETMAHQDDQIGKLVARLKTNGEWEHTLLIVVADHGVAAGSWDYNVLTQDSLPPGVWYGDPKTPMLRPGVSRIPMIFVWPARIAPGQRFSQPVSMIDMLPTILELADLPEPEVMQGQSLAPLLLGEDGWEPRPVILDEFGFGPGRTSELSGQIEVVDGRWGASLWINPDPDQPPELRRPTPLLLFDLWNDPLALHPLNDERPDLVEKYTEFLEAQWEAHQALAQLFTRSEPVALTPEQLRTLRALGYIQ